MTIWSAEIKELEILSTSVKGQFPDLDKELEKLVKADDENMVLLYSRRCLEVIITDLCECELKRPRKTEPLKGIIDKLNREEKVPSNIIASMQSLNSLSTFGAHPKEFDPEQVKPVLNNLTTIIKWYLKYRDARTISTPATAEEAAVAAAAAERSESEVRTDSTEGSRIPKKSLILLLSGLVLVAVIVVVMLIVFGVFGDRKQAEVDTEPEKSIAVLPFDNLSSDEEQAWFSDGITDVIINQLSKISDFRVIGRTSTLKYKEERKSIPEIGAELRVNYIIEGTVQRQENKMRISVQLIQVLNENHIWSDLYDRELKDIFDVQSDIAQRIAEELKTVLTPEIKEQIEESETKNPEAYNLYLQGRFFWSQRTKEGLEKSIDYFEKALAVDPDYALAYAGLADTYYILVNYGLISWIEGTARAKEYALKALEIDQDLAEAHTVLGALLCWADWNFEEARKEFLLAIELNPNYPIAHSYYADLLDILRQNDEARFHINIALELDPFNTVLHIVSLMYYYHEGKLKEALDESLVLQGLDPDYRATYWRSFRIYIRQGEDLKAFEALQKVMLLDTSTAKYANAFREVYSKSGIDGLLNFLIELDLKKSIPPCLSLANWYALLGKKEEAIGWIEKALEENNPRILRINCNPDFDILRSEPGFQAIIKKMGLSEY